MTERKRRWWQRAGEAGRITVTTNMAGRGTDIPLGRGSSAAGRPACDLLSAQSFAAHRSTATGALRATRRPWQCADDIESGRWVGIALSAGLDPAAAAALAGGDRPLPAWLGALLAWVPQSIGGAPSATGTQSATSTRRADRSEVVIRGAGRMKLASGFRRRPRIEEIEARILYSADIVWGCSTRHWSISRRLCQPPSTVLSMPAANSCNPTRRKDKRGVRRSYSSTLRLRTIRPWLTTSAPIRMRIARSKWCSWIATQTGSSRSATRLRRQDISAVHIIAHGSDGEVELGDSKLDFASLLKNATQIKQWGQALTSDADLLIYGCNVAQRTDGQALMDALARLTGADVNASEDVTGNRAFGGDWNLEYRTGSIETHLAISTMEQAGWRGTLAIGDALPSADGGQTAQSTTASGDQAPTTPSQVTLAAVPLAFQPNVGQADDQADFLARGNGYSVWLTGGDAVLDLRDGGTGNVVRLDVLGKNTGVAAQGENEQQAKTNYLVGSQDQWHQDVANYSAVRYNDIYDGVDLRYYGNQQQLEYDFLVNPGANANNIQLKFEGVQSATVADNGDLVLDLGAGRSISFKAPVAYQEGADGREAVSSSYHIAADGTIGFDLGAYDTSRQLVIDPVLSYSTYLGGASADVANGVTVDAAGNVYLVGYTTSSIFPTTPGAYDPNDPDLLLSDVSSRSSLQTSDRCCIQHMWAGPITTTALLSPWTPQERLRDGLHDVDAA